MVPYLSKAPTGPTVRTFVAVELPTDLQARLSTIQDKFGKQTSDIKWVSVELLHITVRFLGSVPEPRIQQVNEAALQSAAAQASFSLAVDGLGSFPGVGRPRVLWAGLRNDDGYSRLGELFRRLEERLADHGFPPEGRSFSPHITLARVRENATRQDLDHIAQTFSVVRDHVSLRGTIPVTHLTVMRSDLTRAGPRYTPLLRASLSGAQ